MEMAFRLTLLGRAEKPDCGLAVIGPDAESPVIHEADAGLGAGLAAFGKRAPHLEGVGIVSGVESREALPKLVVVRLGARFLDRDTRSQARSFKDDRKCDSSAAVYRSSSGEYIDSRNDRAISPGDLPERERALVSIDRGSESSRGAQFAALSPHVAAGRAHSGSSARPVVGAAFQRQLKRRPDFQARSKRSRFITLFHAATKSFTNFSFASAQA
jgi:hypothetical protein